MTRSGLQRVFVLGAQLLVVAVLLGLWQAAAPLGWVDPDTLPPFSAVLDTLWQMLHDRSFLQDIEITGVEVLVAFIVMVPTGLLIGFVIGENRPLYRTLRGPLDLLMAMPKALFLPLFIFVFGIGFAEKVLFSLTLGIFVVILAGIAAVHSIPQGLINAARSMGATKAQIYTRIYLPGMIPLLLNSVRVGLIFTIFGVLVAEMYVSTHGLGRMIFDAGEAYHLRDMLAGVLLIAAISIALSEMLRRFERLIRTRRASFS